MKHIILFLFVLLALISCVKEEEDSPLLSAPVITLKEESPIYKTKIGREITIAPVYENTDSETTFNWTIDGKSICVLSPQSSLANIRFVLLLTMKMAMTK